MNNLKIPPQSTEVEELLLGELMSFPETIDDIVSVINKDDIYKEPNQIIFQAIYDLWSEGKKIDVTVVTNRLNKIGKLDHVGGVFAITKLTTDAITPATVKDHAYIVKETSVKRQFISYAAKVGNRAFANDSDIDELLNIGNSGLDQITDGIFKVGDSLSFKSIIDNTICEYYERKVKFQSGEFTGIRTPLHDLSNITGGWQNGDLIIIAGRPSMGKTAFAVQCGVTAARTGHSVDIYTLEMTSSQFAQRIMSCIEDINIEKFRNGSLSDQEEKLMELSINKLLKLKINLDDKPGITGDYVKAKSSANKRRDKCDIIIVDYLQLMAYDPKLNSNEGYGSITRKFKNLAKELNVPVVLLSQLNRSSEQRGNKRPGLSDLRSSGEIEQDADMVIFPYREFYYSGAEEDKGSIEIIISKHRNGRIGSIDAYHNDTLTKFYDVKSESDYSSAPPPF